MIDARRPPGQRRGGHKRKAANELRARECAHAVLDYSVKPPRCAACGALVIRPNKGPQEQFIYTPAHEVLFGGAAGGSKSFGILLDAVVDAGHKDYRAAIFRREGPQLAKLLEDARLVFGALGAAPRRVSGKRCFEFPSGAQVYFAGIKDAEDIYKWKGEEFHRIYFDELTTFEEDQLTYLMTRLRSAVDAIPTAVKCTSNPDGPGREWVLKRWRWWLYRPGVRTDEHAGPYAKPGEVLWVYMDQTSGVERVVDPAAWLDCPNCGASWRYGEPRRPPAALLPDGSPDPACQHAVAVTRTYIPAFLSDNPALARTDYGDRLAQRDPLTRKRLLEGDWMARDAAGEVFKAGWFTAVDSPPDRVAVGPVRYWDLAGTAEAVAKDHAYTVGVLGCRGVDGVVYVLDVVRKRVDSANVSELVRQTAVADYQRHRRRVTQWIEQDPGQAGAFAAGSIIRYCAGHDVRAVRPSGDKVTRALPLAAQAAPPASNVRVLRAPWNAAYLEELEQFPDGYADQVDASSGLFTRLVRGDARSAAGGARPLAEGGGGGF